MKPIAIDHANVFDDFKDVVVDIELSRYDKALLYVNHIDNGDYDYDMNDVSMLFFVNVDTKTNEVTGINAITYYPEDYGERDYPWKIEQHIVNDVLQFVRNHYIGSEDKYDEY